MHSQVLSFLFLFFNDTHIITKIKVGNLFFLLYCEGVKLYCLNTRLKQ